MRPVIVDFGLSCCIAKFDEVKSEPGTLFFMPPELINGNIDKIQALDVWSLGITFFSFIYEILPFTGKSMNELFISITTEE